MNNHKLATEDAYPPTVKHGRSRTFDVLAHILVVLIGAALLFFALLLVPAEMASVIDEVLGWCVAGVSGLVAVIVAVGLVDRLTD